MSITRTLCLAVALIGVLVGVQRPSASHPVPAAMTAALPASAQVARADAARGTVQDANRATAALSDLAAKYRYLDGATVVVGTTPNGEEAVAYYAEGEIVVSRTHTVGIEAILAHEIWHVIDWRDNGRLDWGEDLPPRGQEAYVKR